MKNIALIMAVAGLALETPSVTLAAQSDTTSSKTTTLSTAESSWSERWQKLESELDKVFHDTVSKLRPATKEKEMTFSSSVDVREKPDAYVASVYLPKSDESNVKVTFENGSLHISANDKTADAYEENIIIPGPVKADKMKVEHKEGLIIATLPKETAGVATVPTPAPAFEPWTEDWDQQVVREMQRMQDRMDQMTRDLLSGVPNEPVITQQPFFGSTVNLENEKDKYVVHFYLPDRDLSNVKVEVKDKQLHLIASEQSKKETASKTAASSEYSAGEYSQMITLPGPVHADQMKIDRKEGTVTVTLPKA
ncbi:MAG TPA: Hsp20 family protein [Bryobacteraceae bacterium]|nr:Hsp20 family protein [Bryobacteraceae bacterium]